jgi:hypothetical protein
MWKLKEVTGTADKSMTMTVVEKPTGNLQIGLVTQCRQHFASIRHQAENVFSSETTAASM